MRRIFEGLGKLLVILPLAGPVALLPLSAYAQGYVGPGGGAATSVSSAAFPLLAPDGANSAPSYSFSAETNLGIYRRTAGQLSFSVSGSEQVRMASGVTSVFSANFNLGADTGLERIAASVLGTTNGSTGEGWIQNEAGDQFLTANATNATVTPANLADLTVSVTSGRKYVFEMIAQIDNSTDADGIRFDFDGGTAAATDFRVTCKSFNNNLTTAVSQTTALATDITEANYVGAGTFECNGSFEPSGTGTFIPRFAMNTAASGTLTVFRGSYLLAKDMP